MRLIPGRVLRPLLLLLVVVAVWPAMAHGISLFKGVMPGKVAEPHAKVEEKCFECHAALGRLFQPKCVACHKDVGIDVTKKRGFHGKTDTAKCEICHPDHKGRAFQLVTFDKETFDHGQTEYPLAGKHAEVACDKCHLKPKFRETPRACYACHEKDDYHKGTLGQDCAQCHVDASWKEIRFDHDKTDFPLNGKHEPLKCEQCHEKESDLKKTPTACVACHKQDDPHKSILGERCESCHTDRDWKTSIIFNHDKTDYPLTGKHRDTKCLDCHKTPQLRETPQVRYTCHKKDDRHKGTLGTQCADCHTTADWKKFHFDHSKTRYPLLGRHIDVACAKCHAGERYKNIPMECAGCHKADDPHKNKQFQNILGLTCETCHTERDWKNSTFDHNKTDFRLLGKHFGTKCLACHTTPELDQTPSTCSGCHRKDDVHKDRLGSRCETCHDAKTWKKAPTFDHQKTEFPLRGKHEPVKCEACHRTKLFADTPTVCVECHKKDDEHKGRFGMQCERCHTDQTWERNDFDHRQETGYSLLGAHAIVKCAQCHTRPLFTTRTPIVCGVCHRNDDLHDGALGPRCDKCHTTENFAITR